LVGKGLEAGLDLGGGVADEARFEGVLGEGVEFGAERCGLGGWEFLFNEQIAGDDEGVALHHVEGGSFHG